MSQALDDLRNRVGQLSGAGLWLWSLLAGILLGVVLMPWLIFLVGRFSLGAYANGGPFALWADFFRGLFDGSLAYWTAALGPCVAVLLALLWRKIRVS